jgi:hypothetical protein
LVYEANIHVSELCRTAVGGPDWNISVSVFQDPDELGRMLGVDKQNFDAEVRRFIKAGG